MIEDYDEMDYPAAHSMDTTWFAVDKDGYIAVMESNEDGAVPVSVPEDQAYLYEKISQATGRILLKDSDRLEMPATIGLYTYSCWDAYPGFNRESEKDQDKSQAMMEDEIVFPYGRTEFFMENGEWKKPDNPLNIKDLPKALQEEINAMQMQKVSFAEDAWIQPALQGQCQFWTFDKSNPRAIDENGAVVPIPIKNIDPRNLDSPETRLSEGQKPWWKKLFGG